jgi:hypothetical protein
LQCCYLTHFIQQILLEALRVKKFFTELEGSLLNSEEASGQIYKANLLTVYLSSYKCWVVGVILNAGKFIIQQNI